MRGKILLLGLLLFSFTFVLAGNSYDVSFEDQNSQAIYLYENDEVRFELLDGEHSIIVEEVSEIGAKFDIVPFIHDGVTNAWPGMATLDTIMKVDLDKDGYYDMNVAVYSVASDGQVHLVLQVADNSDDDDDGSSIVTGLVVDDEEEESDIDWKNYILAVLGILIVIIVAVFVLRSADTEEEKEEAKEEEKEEVKEEAKEEEKEENSDDDKKDDSEEKKEKE